MYKPKQFKLVAVHAPCGGDDEVTWSSSGEVVKSWPQAPSTQGGSRRLPKYSLETGPATDVSRPRAALAKHPSGVHAEDGLMIKLCASGRDPGWIGSSLTFSMVSSSDTSYTTHTTFACGGGRVAQHYQKLHVHTAPALKGKFRDPGIHPSLAPTSQYSLVMSLRLVTWPRTCSNLRQAPPSLLTSRPQHCSSGQSPGELRKDPPKPGTPAFILVLSFTPGLLGLRQ